MNTYSFELDKQLLETIEKRKVILLDTNMWILLADGKTQQAVDLKSKLLALQNQEKIICPLVPTTIWELRSQKAPSLQRTAELMEVLSQNTTYRSHDQIFNYEIAHFIEYLYSGKFSPLTTSEKYGPILSYLGSEFEFESEENGIKFKTIYEHLEKIIRNISLTQLISMLGEQSCPSMNTPKYQQTTQNRLKDTNDSRSKARRIETEIIAKDIFLPIFKKQCLTFSLDKQLEITYRINKLPRSKKHNTVIEYILNFTPALSAYVEVLTLSCLDPNRKDSNNDFFDRELLIYGLSYPTIFASTDGWIYSLIELVRKERHYPLFFKFAHNLDQLEQHIDSLVS